jgi:hypothetical protein
MEVKINILEIASELAHRGTVLISSLNHQVDLETAEEIILQEVDGTSRYTDEAQDTFNNLYDTWFDFILENGEIVESVVSEDEMLKYVEKNYNNYSSCQKVAELNDYMSILDCDIQEGSQAERLVEQVEDEIKATNPGIAGGYLTMRVYNTVSTKYKKLLEELYVESVKQTKL